MLKCENWEVLYQGKDNFCETKNEIVNDQLIYVVYKEYFGISPLYCF